MVSCGWWLAPLLLAKCAAFVVVSNPTQFKSQTVLAESCLDETSRRSFLTSGPFLLGFAALSGAPSNAAAKDELFKPNPLTNSLLEQIRILEQAEADDIKYNGELAAGDAGNKGRVDQYPKLLVPILKMEKELRAVDSLVQGSRDDWKEAMQIMQQSTYDKVAFKKTFNAYGDNIYYGDPDRANLYLGGGATPKSEQSLAYLLRNEILTNVEALQAELAYLLKENDEEKEDLVKYSYLANKAMVGYLKNVSPDEMTKARELMDSDQS